jgi:tRNA-modifying protein YgfZ
MKIEESAAAHAQILETRAGFQLRPELAVVRVSGDDRLSWLNGQITNDLRQLERAESVRALAVNVRGKILADLWVTQAGEQLLLLVHLSALPGLLESLERYIIMEDVTLEVWQEAHVISLAGPQALGFAERVPPSEAEGAIGFGCDELGHGGYVWIGPAVVVEKIRRALVELGAPEIDPAGYELARLRAGVPRYGVDFSDKNYPQEAGLKPWVSFSKGCYLGQEVVCTLENRGRLTRRLGLWRGDGESAPVPGTSLLDESGVSLGEITSAVFDPDAAELLALGYVKRAQAVKNTTLTAAGSELVLARILGDET